MKKRYKVCLAELDLPLVDLIEMREVTMHGQQCCESFCTAYSQ